MSKSRVTEFYATLNRLVNSADKNKVKSTIGDSVNNNRTLTVNQVVRYLRSRRNVQSKNLANNLVRVYDKLRPSITATRHIFTNRTDAIDINELFHAYEVAVLNGAPITRRSFGQLVN